jgi:tetratricopeptide (TPR) repeat protein
MGDQQGIARILNNIGSIDYKKGEYDQALKLYNQSLEIKRQIGDQKGDACYKVGNAIDYITDIIPISR